MYQMFRSFENAVLSLESKDLLICKTTGSVLVALSGFNSMRKSTSSYRLPFFVAHSFFLVFSRIFSLTLHLKEFFCICCLSFLRFLQLFLKNFRVNKINLSFATQNLSSLNAFYMWTSFLLF